MQGQRSTISPLPQNLGFEHGSSSSNTGIDQDVWWSNVQNPAENLLPNYILSPPETNCSYLNSLSQERQNFRHSFGESSSSGAQNQITHDERKVECGWPASVTACAVAGPRLEQREFVSTNVPSPDNLNKNHQVNSDAIPQSSNANIGFEGRDVDNYPGFSCPHFCKSSGPDERAPSASCSSDPFSSSSRSGGSIMEESDGRPGCSMEGRRLSCKRKAVEGNVGQPSLSGNSNCLQHAENSAWHGASARPHIGSSLSISTPSENVLGVSPSEELNPRIGLGMRGASSRSQFSLGGAAGESSHRNFRARINPSHHCDSAPQTLLSAGNAGENGNVMGNNRSVRLVSSNVSLDPRAGLAVDSLGLSGQPMRMHSSPIPRNMRSLRPNALSGSRNQINPVTSSEADPTPSEDAYSRSGARLVGEHPMIVAANEPRNLAQNPTNWNLTSGHISIPGNVASTSHSGSSSGLHPSSAPTWVPHQGPAQHLRPLPEFLRQSMFSFVGSESEGQSSNYSSLGPGPPAPLQEAVQPPASSSNSASEGRRHSLSRAALWLERHGDGILGIPYSLRALASAGEGRSRLVSEQIRNVLDLMRRGEGLRFEDVMILDQSVFFGMADLHDRHRDMRLDVDNMSYEELLALEERIGNVSTGLSEETIWKHLKQRKHLAVAMSAQSEEEPCCICQEEYNNGENLGTLDCGHDFHAECIKQWLTHKNICPICKTTGLVT